jgi:hypothetical protein
VTIAPDGSMAALVPARRALSWQLTDPNGAGVVRERNWVSFQAGEIRVCASCHGINTASHTGATSPTNTPQALAQLLAEWKSGPGPGPGGGGCTNGAAIAKARLRTRPKAPHVLVRGMVTLPDLPTPNDGTARIAIGSIVDIVLPASGWKSKARGSRWRFRDASGAHGGVVRMDVVTAGGRTSFKVLLAADVASMPPGALGATVSFGTAAGCASATWNGPDGPAPRCAGRPGRVACR